MNVDHIYQLQRDQAFAAQFVSQEYRTFVAMPFSNRGGYPESRIRNCLLNEVHERANQMLNPTQGKRRFAPLERVDGGLGGAVVITDQIAIGILECHFFLGDLTGGNTGVVLETGIAIALKPNNRVLLFTQDDATSLHFDLKVTNVNRYTEDDLVEKAATTLLAAADAFEREADRYIRFLSSQLTPDGISLLNVYGRLWKGWRKGADNPALHEESAGAYSDRFREVVGKVAFHNAARELAERRLLWTDYVPNGVRGGDTYGMHATKLGWRVIEHLWHHDPEMREPPGAPTGPNES